MDKMIPASVFGTASPENRGSVISYKASATFNMERHEKSTSILEWETTADKISELIH